MKNTILCIEDNPDNMLLFKRVLEAAGYNLLYAKNGLTGLAQAEAEDIDLILLDINLPDIDGYEVARRIRKSAKSQLGKVPIIVVTANALKGDAQKALDAGCNLYLSKPIDIHTLWAHVDSYLHLSNGVEI
jgi:two-component system, cell cycle response regulator DivK